MYDHVIVSVDGGLDSRVALAPAADLAWRCGAKVVVVSTTRVKGAARDALKGNALARSGADVDFWVDPGASPGRAVLDTVAHRSAPVVVIAGRRRRGGLRRRGSQAPIPPELVDGCTAPLLVIGPACEGTAGLPLGELLVVVDGSPGSRPMAELAAELAVALRLDLRLLVTLPAALAGSAPPAPIEAFLDEVRGAVPAATCEVVASDDPAEAVVARAAAAPTGVVVCPVVGGDHRHPLGSLAEELIERSPRAVLLPPTA